VAMHFFRTNLPQAAQPHAGMVIPKLTILLSGMIAGVPHQGVQLGLSCNSRWRKRRCGRLVRPWRGRETPPASSE
jgi:hypothetical protein